MTNTTTEKQNILIAEFMGGKQGKDFEGYDGRWTDDWFIDGERVGFLYPNIFSGDWNRLMSVVEKIQKLPSLNDDHYSYYWGISSISCSFRTRTKLGYPNDINAEVQVKNFDFLKSTYRAVVQFIQWYNTEKAKQVYPKSIGPINQNPEFYVNFFTDILERKCFNALQTPEACKCLLNYAENKLIEANLNKA